MAMEQAVRVAQEALYLSLLLSAPVVVLVAAIGMIVSVFQAATQVQEQSISVVVKTIAAYAVIAGLGLAALEQLVQFAGEMFRGVAEIGR